MMLKKSNMIIDYESDKFIYFRYCKNYNTFKEYIYYYAEKYGNRIVKRKAFKRDEYYNSLSRYNISI